MIYNCVLTEVLLAAGNRRAFGGDDRGPGQHGGRRKGRVLLNRLEDDEDADPHKRQGHDGHQQRNGSHRPERARGQPAHSQETAKDHQRDDRKQTAKRDGDDGFDRARLGQRRAAFGRIPAGVGCRRANGGERFGLARAAFDHNGDRRPLDLAAAVFTGVPSRRHFRPARRTLHGFRVPSCMAAASLLPPATIVAGKRQGFPTSFASPLLPRFSFRSRQLRKLHFQVVCRSEEPRPAGLPGREHASIRKIGQVPPCRFVDHVVAEPMRLNRIHLVRMPKRMANEGALPIIERRNSA